MNQKFINVFFILVSNYSSGTKKGFYIILRFLDKYTLVE